MNNTIGIVMGGYIDEHGKLMNRAELDRRVSAIQLENENLKDELENIKDTPQYLKNIELERYTEELEYELNNSKMFHCPHFLTNESGAISCQKDFQTILKTKLAKAVEFIEVAYYFDKEGIESVTFSREVLEEARQFLAEIKEKE